MLVLLMSTVLATITRGRGSLYGGERDEPVHVGWGSFYGGE